MIVAMDRDRPAHVGFVCALLSCEALAFAAASMAHRGWLVTGYEHGRAATAEIVIAAILAAGAASAWFRPAWARAAGLAVQIFALLGTLVGVFVVVIGVGPQTLPDKLYHAAMVPVLVAGLVMLARMRASQA